ncbi:MAG: hypothetical protein ACUBOA_13290 [Candidatus Loosdrechtia sp.]
MIIVKDTKHRINPEGVTENTDSSCYPFGVVNHGYVLIGYNYFTPSGLPHIYPQVRSVI